MTLKEQVTQDLERLDEGGLREVADFVAFLQFRTRRQATPVMQRGLPKRMPPHDGPAQ